MSTAVVKKMNKEIKTLRRDISQIKSALVGMLAIPKEDISTYKNAARLKQHIRQIAVARRDIAKRRTVAQEKLFKELGF